MKHRSNVKEFGIELQFFPDPSQRPEMKHPGRVVEKEVRLSVPCEFGGALRQFAVRDADTVDRSRCNLHGDTLVVSPPNRFANVPTI